jgi:hypothetical protein
MARGRRLSLGEQHIHCAVQERSERLDNVTGLNDLQTRGSMIDWPIEPNDILGMAAVDDGLGFGRGVTHVQRSGRCDGRTQDR